jgi:hypothetical protein
MGSAGPMDGGNGNGPMMSSGPSAVDGVLARWDRMGPRMVDCSWTDGAERAWHHRWRCGSMGSGRPREGVNGIGPLVSSGPSAVDRAMTRWDRVGPKMVAVELDQWRRVGPALPSLDGIVWA